MGKSATVQVIQNRLLFRCPACKSRRNIAVLPNLRQKVIVCHKCQLATKCILNRRTKPREPQAGKVLLVTNDNRETEITMHDISPEGAGFDLPYGIQKSLRIAVGTQVRFKCAWNPKLLGNFSYEVKSIIGQRVGVQRK